MSMDETLALAGFDLVVLLASDIFVRRVTKSCCASSSPHSLGFALALDSLPIATPLALFRTTGSVVRSAGRGACPKKKKLKNLLVRKNKKGVCVYGQAS
jgi:hypothetical protein